MHRDWKITQFCSRILEILPILQSVIYLASIFHEQNVHSLHPSIHHALSIADCNRANWMTCFYDQHDECHQNDWTHFCPAINAFLAELFCSPNGNLLPVLLAAWSVAISPSRQRAFPLQPFTFLTQSAKITLSSPFKGFFFSHKAPWYKKMNHINVKLTCRSNQQVNYL